MEPMNTAEFFAAIKHLVDNVLPVFITTGIAFYVAQNIVKQAFSLKDKSEKQKNNDPSPEKPKNDQFLGTDDDGEMVFTSDFENAAGAAEWLKSRGVGDEK